jgi:hypothetical protein
MLRWMKNGAPVWARNPGFMPNRWKQAKVCALLENFSEKIYQ